MMTYELDDIDKEVLMGRDKVVDRPGTKRSRSSEQIEIEDDLRCRECGSTEAGSCFYCKAD